MFLAVQMYLFQENRNCAMNKLIKSMGANKTEKAIERASKVSGGVSEIVEAFEAQMNIQVNNPYSEVFDQYEVIIARDLGA